MSVRKHMADLVCIEMVSNKMFFSYFRIDHADFDFYYKRNCSNCKTYFRERTVLMSMLNGIGVAIFPLAEFLSGQLYQVRLDKTWKFVNLPNEKPSIHWFAKISFKKMFHDWAFFTFFGFRKVKLFNVLFDSFFCKEILTGSKACLTISQFS